MRGATLKTRDRTAAVLSERAITARARRSASQLVEGLETRHAALEMAIRQGGEVIRDEAQRELPAVRKALAVARGRQLCANIEHRDAVDAWSARQERIWQPRIIEAVDALDRALEEARKANAVLSNVETQARAAGAGRIVAGAAWTEFTDRPHCPTRLTRWRSVMRGARLLRR